MTSADGKTIARPIRWEKAVSAEVDEGWRAAHDSGSKKFGFPESVLRTTSFGGNCFRCAVDTASLEAVE